MRYLELNETNGTLTEFKEIHYYLSSVMNHIVVIITQIAIIKEFLLWTYYNDRL